MARGGDEDGAELLIDLGPMGVGSGGADHVTPRLSHCQPLYDKTPAVKHVGRATLSGRGTKLTQESAKVSLWTWLFWLACTLSPGCLLEFV